MGVLDAPGLSPTIAQRRYSSRDLAVANRTWIGPLSAGGITDGTTTTGLYRVTHTAPIGCHDLQLLYSNVYNNVGAESDNPNPITVTAAIEYPIGVYHPVTFNGRRSVEIGGGLTVQSDPVAARIPAGASFWSRTFVQVALGEKWPLGKLGVVGSSSLDRSMIGGPSLTDFTLTDDAQTDFSNTRQFFGPSGIVGIQETKSPVVAVVGDSITAGLSASSNLSWATTALDAAQIPYIDVSMSSAQMDKWSLDTSRRRRAGLLSHATHVLSALGVNNLSGAWPSPVQTQLQNMWAYFTSLGLPIVQTTLTPQTTSTDAWATVENQTLLDAGHEATRQSFNAYVRSSPPLISGYLDIASYVESSLNSGKFAVTGGAWTNDGTHMVTNGHDRTAAQINSDALRALFGMAPL